MLHGEPPSAAGILESVEGVGYLRVLVVDDDQSVLRMLAKVFTRWGCEVSAAATYEEGLELLALGVDLVVTDVNLPSGSGLEIARAAATMHPAPPVIAITGGATVEEALLLGRVGVGAILSKPFRPSQLREVVENLEPPPPDVLDAFVRRIVGAEPMPELLDAVRRSMVVEALARTGNNKAQAASLLGISRQHLQKILERGKA